jgi:hypothetical protein
VVVLWTPLYLFLPVLSWFVWFRLFSSDLQDPACFIVFFRSSDFVWFCHVFHNIRDALFLSFMVVVGSATELFIFSVGLLFSTSSLSWVLLDLVAAALVSWLERAFWPVVHCHRGLLVRGRVRAGGSFIRHSLRLYYLTQQFFFSILVSSSCTDFH